MTDEQKLEELVRRAVENGLDEHTYHSLPISAFHIDLEVGILGKFFSDDGEEIDVATVIFSHDFARALFGEYPTYVTQGFERYDVGKDVKSWLGPAKEAIKDESFTTGALTYRALEYHIMQAAISKDPIDYMYKVVFGNPKS